MFMDKIKQRRSVLRKELYIFDVSYNLYFIEHTKKEEIFKKGYL